MREAERDKQRLEDILEAIDYAQSFVEGLTFEEFQKDKRTYFAVVKNVEIIGEAAYKLTLDFKESNPVVDWQVVVNMRHVLVHGYYNIDPQVLWDTVNNDLPTFRIQIQSLMEKIF